MNIGKLCRVPCVPYAYTHAFVQSLRRVSLMREVFVLGRIKFIGQLLSSAKQQCSKMLCENLFSLMHMTWCVLQFPFVALCSFCEISKYLCVCVRVYVYESVYIFGSNFEYLRNMKKGPYTILHAILWETFYNIFCSLGSRHYSILTQMQFLKYNDSPLQL